MTKFTNIILLLSVSILLIGCNQAPKPVMNGNEAPKSQSVQGNLTVTEAPIQAKVNASISITEDQPVNNK